MNLYVHFPFCRGKCAYCALYSRTGVSASARDAYVEALADQFHTESTNRRIDEFSAVYFGGGSPALCDLKPVFAALAPRLGADTEFTVELHPLDVNERTLSTLRAGGVNRISMGVQSLDDRILAAMGRGYSAVQAARAFALVKRYFDNAGIDLIEGYPGSTARVCDEGELSSWGLRHCSVYSLQNERGLADVPDDEVTLDRIREDAAALKTLGLERYEISNYAAPGCECRHNLAVWRGEDYLGLGEGACGRIGLLRTTGVRGQTAAVEYREERVDEATDRKERTLFRLRTREGLDTSDFPEWRETLDRFVAEGLLTRREEIYFLTLRGTEVCDSILAEIV